MNCEECGKDTELLNLCFVFVKTEGLFDECQIWCSKCQNITNPYWISLVEPDGNGYFGNNSDGLNWDEHLACKNWFDRVGFEDKVDKCRRFLIIK